jgi:hypothetical protein
MTTDAPFFPPASAASREAREYLPLDSSTWHLAQRWATIGCTDAAKVAGVADPDSELVLGWEHPVRATAVNTAENMPAVNRCIRSIP